MQRTTFNVALINQPKSKNTESKDWTSYDTSIALGIGGGLFFILLGFFLLVIFTFFDRNNTALNYAGVVALVVAFIFFAVSAHFMDVFEENKSQMKRAGIEKFNRK